MNILNILLLILFIGVRVASAQGSDSTSEKKPNKTETKIVKEVTKEQKGNQENKDPKMTPEKLEGFVDLNANGIDDRIENAGKSKGNGKKQPKDRFVAMDGDGICDGKESAIGLKKLYRKRKGNPHR
jgi:hypothetical protein